MRLLSLAFAVTFLLYVFISASLHYALLLLSTPVSYKSAPARPGSHMTLCVASITPSPLLSVLFRTPILAYIIPPVYLLVKLSRRISSIISYSPFYSSPTPTAAVSLFIYKIEPYYVYGHSPPSLLPPHLLIPSILVALLYSTL